VRAGCWAASFGLGGDDARAGGAAEIGPDRLRAAFRFGPMDPEWRAAPTARRAVAAELLAEAGLI
jgi:hypothetical protein